MRVIDILGVGGIWGYTSGIFGGIWAIGMKYLVYWVVDMGRLYGRCGGVMELWGGCYVGGIYFDRCLVDGGIGIKYGRYYSDLSHMGMGIGMVVGGRGYVECWGDYSEGRYWYSMYNGMGVYLFIMKVFKVVLWGGLGGHSGYIVGGIQRMVNNGGLLLGDMCGLVVLGNYLTWLWYVFLHYIRLHLTYCLGRDIGYKLYRGGVIRKELSSGIYGYIGSVRGRYSGCCGGCEGYSELRTGSGRKVYRLELFSERELWGLKYKSSRKGVVRRRKVVG